MRRFGAIAILGAMIGFGLPACAQPELVNGIQAVVHDSIVTVAEVEEMTFPARQILYREFRSQPDVFLRKLAAAKTENLGQLIDRQLILHDFNTTFSQPERKAIIDKEIEKEVDQEVEAAIRSNYGGSRVTFIKSLQGEGVTLERYRQRIRDRMIWGWLRQKNVSSEVIVSPHRVEVYYLAHRDEFKMEEEVKLRMIVLKCSSDSEVEKTAKLADDIHRALKEGATFAEMATIHSEGSQRSQGGELGWWEPSRLSKSLADTAASLQAGQHSPVLSRSPGDDYWVCQYSNTVPVAGRHYQVDTTKRKEILAEERSFDSLSSSTNLPPPSEFYLMLVEDRRPPRFKTLKEVREQIEKDLDTQERTRLEKQWIDKLKKKTFVRVF